MAVEVELGKGDAHAADGNGTAAKGAAGGEEEEKPKVEYAEHTWSLPELESKLAIKLDTAYLHKSTGLTVADAKKRLEENGPNALTPPPVVPWFMLLLAKFLDPFMILLEIYLIFLFII